MNRHPPISRRGSVGLAMIVALVTVELVIVGVVVAGARAQDLAANRLDSARAAFAAEAGQNMALREIMNNADEDGDGGIGTISDDGDAGNDPALGPARVCVTGSVVGNVTTLTSRGTSGLARRQTDATVDMGSGGGGSSGTTMVAFGRSGSNQPRYSVWNGSAWGAAGAMPDIGGVANAVVARACPTRNETMFVAQDSAEDVNVVFHNGTSWGSVTQVCSNTGQTSRRPFDGAYEQTSGDGLVVYWKDSGSQIAYRTYNGSTLSGESVLALSDADECRFLSLYSRPENDTIILLALNTQGGDEDGDTCLSAAVWNGVSWGSWTTLTSNGATTSRECYSLAFEGLSTTALCVYGEDNVSTPRYRTWNGTSWSSQSSMPSISEDPRWVRLAADPASDAILFGALNKDDEIRLNAWNGSSWGSNLNAESNAGSSDRRQFDIAWESGTGHGLVAYSQASSSQLRYRTWSGSSWSSEQNGTNIGTGQAFIQARTGTGAGQVFLAVQTSGNGLRMVQWSGSSMSSDTDLESSLGGSSSTEPFMLAVPARTDRPRVVSWQEVQPQ